MDSTLLPRSFTCSEASLSVSGVACDSLLLVFGLTQSGSPLSVTDFVHIALSLLLHSLLRLDSVSLVYGIARLGLSLLASDFVHIGFPLSTKMLSCLGPFMLAYGIT